MFKIAALKKHCVDIHLSISAPLRPPGKSNKEVLELLASGFRLPSPARCPQNIYRIMLDCWAPEALQRPSFHALHSQLDSIYARIYFKTIEV